jgi:hypothetical protein
MANKVKTGFLYADPSFISGYARTLDLFGQFDSYNQSLTPAEADAKALAADWIIAGQDIVDALEHFEAGEAA